MEQLIERCAGLDVHKDTVVVCVRLTEEGGKTVQEIQTFGTTTPDLLALRDWLESIDVTHVAMESTGVYWKPVYYLLEDVFTVLLVNAAHIKNVPGRKTDVTDCAWIAQLLAHGILRGSFVPEKPIRDLRDLTRHRKILIQERSREANRLHKALQDSGIKLSSVATNILGVSGRAMIDALVEGKADPTALSELAKGKLKKKLPALQKALTGRFRSRHAFLVSRILAHLDYLEDEIEAFSQKIEEEIHPFDEAVALLDTIPGVNRRTAEVLIAEIGPDMTRFPSARHLASWAGLCPGNNESAGKHKSGKTRKGDRWLRITLTESALAAVRDKDSALSAQYRRIMRHRGHKKAIVAVAHSILCISYHILSDRRPYSELGAVYLEKREKDHAVRRYVKQLERLGHKVTLEPVA
ncbi:MAG: IS110 family RNA-guided transposase [Leptospirales bacterium]